MGRILIILSVVIIILLGLLGITYNQLRQQRDDAIRWENNYQEVSKDVARIQLTLNEFKEQATAKEDSLLKELSIKPKQVEKIVYIENTYINEDTIEIFVEDMIDLSYIPDPNELMGEGEAVESNKKQYGFIQSIDCLTVRGSIETSDPKTKLQINSLIYQNTNTYVAYWQRRQWKFLGIKTRVFGKKQGELEISSTCGNTTVKEIDIIKK